MLLSPLSLRSYGVGQIDLARFDQIGVIKIYEVKSSIPHISKAQGKRIKKAADLIGSIFSAAVIFEIIS